MYLETRKLNPNPKPVLIRQVWAANLEDEFELIRLSIDQYCFISMDTEFPGTIFRPLNPAHLRPSDLYWFLRSNVDALNLIQVGITLSDASGNLPDFGTANQFIWEFNFSDFDVHRDAYAPDSIDLLRRQGIDFERNRKEGVNSGQFAELMITSGLVCNSSLTWVSFHSGYDFGYLVKILTHRRLPGRLENFMGVVRFFFGNQVYDVKHVMKFCDGLYGGLERVAKTLEVKRGVGKCHQAGSDSLLTWETFQKMVRLHFENDVPEYYSGVLYGLELCHQ